MTALTNLKSNLWTIRTSKNLILQELSQLTQISPSTLNKIENNKIYPTIYTLERIAEGLNCKIQDLITSDYI